MIHHNVVCEYCGNTFTYESKRKTPRRLCGDACRKAEHYRANKGPYLERAREQKQDPAYQAKERQRYAQNRVEIRAKNKAYRERNAEKVRARKAEYYRANRDARLAYWHEWVSVADNREQTRRNTKAWAARNPEKVMQHAALRRARMFAAKVENVSPMEVFNRDEWVCQLCGKPVDPAAKHPDPMSKSLDHIVPLSRGGEHSRANTQLAHLRCNVAKNNRLQDTTHTRAYS